MSVVPVSTSNRLTLSVHQSMAKSKHAIRAFSGHAVKVRTIARLERSVDTR